MSTMQSLKGGEMNKIQLRDWQKAALNKAEQWLLGEDEQKHFLINAAPGAGKTRASIAIAALLIERGDIERVIVIAPRSEVVNQWAEDFKLLTGRFMAKVTGADHEVSEMSTDVCATWQAIQGLSSELQAVCRHSKTLVICDEHHHAAVEAAWGTSATSAFIDAKYVLILTGTPIRSDGNESVWLAYDDFGAIEHPAEGSYTLTYGECVDFEYCRPITFHRHEGKFAVDLENDTTVLVSSQKDTELPSDFQRVDGLQRALEFYKLACTPQYEKDNETPLSNGYQATMLNIATEKLDDLRQEMPQAGGLVIASSIEMAGYMRDLIALREGETPVIVHSEEPSAASRIAAFRHGKKRWLVSVGMISEGVDIPRLRVLIYLPYAKTELAFRQAMGRVVRTLGREDYTRAYVIMPSLKIFDEFAKRVELEMSPSKRANAEPKERTKHCPECGTKCSWQSTSCDVCGHDFPEPPPRTKPCPHCDTLNPIPIESCINCDESFKHAFTFSLREALRDGAIVRGADFDEGEVKEGERLSPAIKRRVLASGDEVLIAWMAKFPSESYARLNEIFKEARGDS